METIAQEKLAKPVQKDKEDYGGRIDREEFWEEIGRRIREGIRIMFSLIQMINEDWKTRPMKNFI